MSNKVFSKASIATGVKSSLVEDQTTYPTLDCQVLVVAGGGGGGGQINGGAGAGGLLYYGSETPKTPNGSAYAAPRGVPLTVTVGAGGVGWAGFEGGNTNTEGSHSVFGTLIAYGGGTCGPHTSETLRYSFNGGSGAGGMHDGQMTPGSGYPGQGNRGGWMGYRAGNNYPGGGGGGAGAAGQDPAGGNSNGGNGGVGLQYSISGTATYYAGGGGAGSGYSGYGYGTGGTGGGGTNGSGTANTGGGGSGAASNTNNGGSGIVIVRYSDTSPAAVTTGSPTVTVTGGWRIYKFTGDGTITLP